MKLQKLINRLEKIKARHGDVDVFIYDEEGRGPAEVAGVAFDVIEEDDYPEDWNMPDKGVFIRG